MVYINSAVFLPSLVMAPDIGVVSLTLFVVLPFMMIAIIILKH